jgi:hypothetical protein
MSVLQKQTELLFNFPEETCSSDGKIHRTRPRGSRITLEHSLMHHFGAQPFSTHFGTQNDTYHQNNANHTDMRFTDRPNTLEAWRVLKQEQDKKNLL